MPSISSIDLWWFNSTGGMGRIGDQSMMMTRDIGEGAESRQRQEPRIGDICGTATRG